MAGTNVLVLGPVAARPDGDPPVVLPGKAATLLAVLAATHPVPQPSSTLIDALWDGAPTPTAAVGLRVVVSTVRRALRPADAGDGDPGPVAFDAGCYRLALPATAIDAGWFEELLGRSRDELATGDPAAAIASVEAALSLWRGPAYGALADLEAVRPEATRLELLRLDAEDHLVEALLGAGDARRAATLAESMASAEPLREHRWSQLMLALYRSGRQAEALRAFQRARAVLVDELGLEPGAELRAMEQAVLMQDPELESAATADAADPVDVGRFVRALRATTRRPPSPMSPLVGRVVELARIDELLKTRRQVTVVGPGGAGKTRLALAIADERSRAEQARVAFVPLAGETAASIVTALAHQLMVGGRPGEDLTQTIVAHLRAGPATIVLDNCEHVAGEAGRLTHALVSDCPEVEVLVTSRVALGIEGESRVPVGALSDDDARQLLAERAAAAVGRAVDVDAVPGGVVGRILDRLDRLPLAIELAAGQLDTMSWGELDAIVAGPRDAIRSVGRVDERHRDLAAAVDWSYGLLDDALRPIFDGLGVMAGTFTAADVAGIQRLDVDRAAAALRTLASASVVVARPGEAVTQFELLETMRWYAAQRLGRREPALRAAHADHYTSLVGRLSEEIRGPDEQAAAIEFAVVLDDVRAVLRRAVERGDLDRAVAIACATWRYGMNRLHYDLLGVGEDVLTMPGALEHRRAGELLGAAGHKAWLHSEPEEAERYAAAALARIHPDGWSVPIAHGTIVNVAGYGGDIERALRSYQAMLAWAKAEDDPYWLASCYVTMTIAASVVGMPDMAQRAVQRAAAQAARIDNPSSSSWVSYASALAVLDADVDEAIAHFERGVAVARSVVNSWLAGMNLSGLATALRRQGRLDDARTVLREVTELWHRGNVLSQLRHALTEAALVVAADDREAAALALGAADRIVLGFPMLPADRPLVDELRRAAGRSGADDHLARRGGGGRARPPRLSAVTRPGTRRGTPAGDRSAAPAVAGSWGP